MRSEASRLKCNSTYFDGKLRFAPLAKIQTNPKNKIHLFQHSDHERGHEIYRRRNAYSSIKNALPRTFLFAPASLLDGFQQVSNFLFDTKKLKKLYRT